MPSAGTWCWLDEKQRIYLLSFFMWRNFAGKVHRKKLQAQNLVSHFFQVCTQKAKWSNRKKQVRNGGFFAAAPRWNVENDHDFIYVDLLPTFLSGRFSMVTKSFAHRDISFLVRIWLPLWVYHHEFGLHFKTHMSHTQKGQISFSKSMKMA